MCFPIYQKYRIYALFPGHVDTLLRYGISDIHNQNVIFDEVNDRLVVIDLGGGVL